MLHRYGGAYADIDVIALRPMQSLKRAALLAAANGTTLFNGSGPSRSEVRAWRAGVEALAAASPDFDQSGAVEQLVMGTLAADIPSMVAKEVAPAHHPQLTRSYPSSSGTALFVGVEIDARATPTAFGSDYRVPVQYVQWWLIASGPGHSALLDAAQLMQRRVSSGRVHGPASAFNSVKWTLWLTGPWLFTDAIERWRERADGESSPGTARHSSGDMLLVLPQCVAGYLPWHQVRDCSLHTLPYLLHMFKGSWKPKPTRRTGLLAAAARKISLLRRWWFAWHTDPGTPTTRSS